METTLETSGDLVKNEKTEKERLDREYGEYEKSGMISIDEFLENKADKTHNNRRCGRWGTGMNGRKIWKRI